MMLHTFVVYVEDKPGVLNRVCVAVPAPGVQHRLAHGRSHRDAGRLAHDDRLRRRPDGARRVEANIYKLVDVLRVDDITEQPAVERELAMIKVVGDARDAHADHPAGRRLPRADGGRLATTR